MNISSHYEFYKLKTNENLYSVFAFYDKKQQFHCDTMLSTKKYVILYTKKDKKDKWVYTSPKRQIYNNSQQ